MNFNQILLDFYNRKPIFSSMLIITIMSLILFINNADHINRDGILYIFQANALSLGDHDLARTLYPSIFLPKIIDFLSRLMSLSLIDSARFIGFIFFLITAFFYLKTIYLIKPESNIVFLGLIIFTTSLLIDKYMVMILRDHGLWVGLSGSTYFFLKWLRNKNLYLLLTSFIFIFFGSLFREELLSVIIINLFLLTVLANKNNITLSKTFYLSLVAFVFFIIIFSYVFNSSNIYFSRFEDIVNLMFMSFSQLFSPLPFYSDNYWLSELSKDNPMLLKYGFFGTIFIFKWLSAIGISLIFLYLSSLYFKYSVIGDKLYLYSIALLTLIWPLLNMLSTNVLSSRYLIPHTLIIMILSTLGFWFFIKNFPVKINKFKKPILYFIFFIFLIRFLDVIVDTNKTSNDQLAAMWIHENKLHVENVFTQNNRIRYYLDILTPEDRTLDDNLSDFDTLIFDNRLSNNNPIFDSFELSKIIPSSDNPKLFIYLRKN